MWYINYIVTYWRDSAVPALFENEPENPIAKFLISSTEVRND